MEETKRLRILEKIYLTLKPMVMSLTIYMELTSHFGKRMKNQELNKLLRHAIRMVSIPRLKLKILLVVTKGSILSYVLIFLMKNMDFK